MTRNNNTKEIFIITLKLLIICSIVATIVAFVNFITKDRIALNEKENTAKAISDIYSDEYKSPFIVSGDNFVIYNDNKIVFTCSKENISFASKNTKALYVLKDSNSDIHGYCVSIQPMGFKDYIKMLVAITPECTVKDVKIVSMSETSGIGTKALEPSFLEKFKDLNESRIQREVDVISGATKTSRPIIDAVHDSLTEVSIFINSSGGEH